MTGRFRCRSVPPDPIRHLNGKWPLRRPFSYLDALSLIPPGPCQAAAAASHARHLASSVVARGPDRPRGKYGDGTRRPFPPGRWFLAGLRGQLSAGRLPAASSSGRWSAVGHNTQMFWPRRPVSVARSPAAPAQTSWFAAKRPPATSTGAPACYPSRARRRGTARAAAEVAACWSSWRASSRCRNCWSASSARPAGRGTYRPNIPGQHPN